MHRLISNHSKLSCAELCQPQVLPLHHYLSSRSNQKGVRSWHRRGETYMRFDIFLPRNEKQLLKFVARRKTGVMLVAGGTDVIPKTQRGETKVKCLVDMSHLENLRYIDVQDDIARIGALTRISDFKNEKVIGNNYEAFRRVANGFGGPSIANMATVGGNVCAASSSADLLPVLLALDAKVTTRSLRGDRTVMIKDFLLRKGKTRLRPGEIIAEVQFEACKSGTYCAFRKIGRRSSLFMATVSVSTFIDLDLKSMRIKRARVAFNAWRGFMPDRAAAVETALVQKKLEDKVIKKAASKLVKEFSVPSDQKSSAEYKVEAAKVLLEEQLQSIEAKARGG
jgi:CO/xanthine dehydrogenase FAD-binding subunit